MEVITMGRSNKPYTSFPIHRHGYWEILLNLSGSGTMLINDTKYFFHPGDIFLLPPDIPHGKISEQGFEDMCMFVKDMRPIGDSDIRRIVDDEHGTIRNLMQVAYRISETPAENAPYNTAAILNAMGESIYQMLVGFFVTGRQKDLRIDGFIECLEANITNPDFDLSTEAEKTGYCKGHFRKIFKEATGETPVTYFNRIRIEYAKKEFQHYGNSRSVKDVALASGFRDPYYFSRVFKKVESISPASYLKQLDDFDEEKIDRDNLRPGKR